MEAKTDTRDEDLRKIIKEMPQRANAWLKMSQSWRQLTNSSLSDDAIDAWFEEKVQESIEKGPTRRKR
jgi:hypothetical protein